MSSGTCFAVRDGDLTNDGKADVADALIALKIAVALIPSTAAAITHGDVAPLDALTRGPKGDGKIDIVDALAILRHVVNLDSWKPAVGTLVITSTDRATFQVGTFQSFTVTAVGNPAPSFSLSGILPAGVAFDAPNGILSGSASGEITGSFPLTLTASNGAAVNVTQDFVLTVDDPLSTAGSTLSSKAKDLIGIAGPMKKGTWLLDTKKTAQESDVYSYTFDAAGNVTGKTETYTPTNTSFTLPGTRTWTYDSHGQAVSYTDYQNYIGVPNGTFSQDSTYTYDASGRIQTKTTIEGYVDTSSTAHYNINYVYTYSASGLVIDRSVTGTTYYGVALNYSDQQYYDQKYNFSNAGYVNLYLTSGLLYCTEYHSSGNPIQYTYYTYLADGRIYSSNGTTYTYDVNGNLTYDGYATYTYKLY
jgi:hypothetical protein